MNKSNVININENSPEFLRDLERRIVVAKKQKNRIPLTQAKKDILAKYNGIAHAKV